VFTRDEIKDLVVALAITILIFSSGMYRQPILSLVTVLSNPKLLLYVITVVTISLVPHEFLHKYVAMKLGYPARYMLSKRLALLSLISILLPFKIIATGYVAVFSWYPIPRRDEGLIAVAGPTINLILALATTTLYVVLGNFLLWFIAWINSLILFFNLLPIPPLDGWRILKWSFKLWITIFLISIALLVVTYVV